MRLSHIIDCGSRSIKLHEMTASSVTVKRMASWDPMGHAVSVVEVQSILADLVNGISDRSRIEVIGTAAARRDRDIETAVSEACNRVGLRYRTLSQVEEATLIQNAFGHHSEFDIVNAGGGSIQIVQAGGEMVLVETGISDLNSKFALNLPAAERQTKEAAMAVRLLVPRSQRPFIYSGGERGYLKKLGARLGDNGLCSRSEFIRVTSRLELLSLEELEALSPFDPKWMHGAIASNILVGALLEASGQDHFYASDLNIADGILGQIAAK